VKRRIYIALIALVVLLVALGGWTVEAARWLTTGSRSRLATAS
jgi:hypothetical protein